MWSPVYFVSMNFHWWQVLYSIGFCFFIFIIFFVVVAVVAVVVVVVVVVVVAPGLPDPTSIERQKNAYARGLEEQLRRVKIRLTRWPKRRCKIGRRVNMRACFEGNMERSPIFCRIRRQWCLVEVSCACWRKSNFRMSQDISLKFWWPNFFTVFPISIHFMYYTHSKTNMQPENDGSWKESPPGLHFQVPCSFLRGV